MGCIMSKIDEILNNCNKKKNREYEIFSETINTQYHTNKLHQDENNSYTFDWYEDKTMSL